MQQANFIDGIWRNGDGATLLSISPLDGEVVWRGHTSERPQVDEAVRAARRAFPEWSRLERNQRVAICRKFQLLLKQNTEVLADIIHRETGKPLWESRTEVASMVGKVELSIAAQQERAGEQTRQVAAGTARLDHRPHGVIALFGPYNFPGHLPNGHIVPALLAGNCLVFKPSEHSPGVGELMTDYWQQAGIPTGVINLVQGSRETGEALASHGGIDGIFFTGSSATGELLHRQFAGNTGKILALEMGGNNPLVAHRLGNIKAAVYATIQSAFISAGQRCTCARRLIVIDDDESAAFLEALVEATEKLRVSARDEDAFCGPVISEQAADQLLMAQQNLLAMGGKSILPMQRLAQCPALLRPGIIDVSAVPELPDREYFGPLLQLIRVQNFDQAIEAANHTRFGLAAGLLSEDPALWQEFYLRSRAGIVNWNKPLTGASGAAPFGGIGASGNHRPSAWYAADYCAYPVASLIDEHIALPDNLSPGVSL